MTGRLAKITARMHHKLTFKYHHSYFQFQNIITYKLE